MNTYPENGVVEDHTKCYPEDSVIICKSRVRYCVNASKSSGLTENYTFTEVYVNDWYDSCNAYAEFNKDPSYTNSPRHIVKLNEKVKFLIHINTYGEIYASKPTYPVFSEARIRFYIYIYKLISIYPEEKWSLVYGFHRQWGGWINIFWTSSWRRSLLFLCSSLNCVCLCWWGR
jgi:hypothetical protein